jgi:hypothetical protein
MPRYVIRRDIPDATQEVVDAASMRAIWCLRDFPEVRWVRSYWDQSADRILCIYDAPNEEMLRQHSESSRLPCDEVLEVTQFGPETYLAETESVPESWRDQIETAQEVSA